MTVRALDLDSIIARNVLRRDWAADHAAYYRRRAPDDEHTRRLMVELEILAGEIDDDLPNLRALRREVQGGDS